MNMRASLAQYPAQRVPRGCLREFDPDVVLAAALWTFVASLRAFDLRAGRDDGTAFPATTAPECAEPVPA